MLEEGLRYDNYDKITMARTIKVTPGQQKIWCIVTQRNDISLSFKFKEDAKGQDVMDEV